MAEFGSGDYLFLTHLDGYNEDLVGREQVRALIEDFPGEVYLVNEFPEDHEDFEKQVSGEELLSEENLLQTRVGLGEPRTVPMPSPETAYFGGFNMPECLSNTVDKASDFYGEESDYAVLKDYTIHGFETLEEKIGDEEAETLEELVEKGILEEEDVSLYPPNCRVVVSDI
jgi:hypothetical protein